MTDPRPPYNFQVVEQLEEVPEEAWQQCALTDNPFTDRAFLLALEQSGSVSVKNGWQPFHIITRDASGAIVGLLPTYRKRHSYGEFVFDFSWADAFHRHGFDYYPKLVSAIPFTPSPGPRFLQHPDLNFKSWLSSYLEWLQGQAEEGGFSSWHLLFPEASVATALDHSQLLKRTGVQYHWLNQDYQHFDDFLDRLKSRKRKAIRKERKAVQQKGITFRWVEGGNLSAEARHTFYQFYALTYYKRGQHPYLNPQFFEQINEAMPRKVIYLFAYCEQRPIAAALFFKDSKALYGRHWGCAEEYDFLHFECCYYQGIDYAITHHLQRFDAGTQGEHKLSRGFEPRETTSWHWIAHPDFRQAIARFLEEEQDVMQSYRTQAALALPYRALSASK